MARRVLGDLTSERKIILWKITHRPVHETIKAEGASVKMCRRMFEGMDDFLKTPENVEYLERLAEAYHNESNQIMYRLDCLYLYRAACLAHKEYCKQSNIPDAFKEVSADNIRLYEKALKEQGFTEEMMKDALEKDDFDKKYFAEFEDRLKGLADGFAREHGLKIHEELKTERDENGPAKLTPAYVAGRTVYHKNDKTQPPRLAPQNSDAKDVYCRFAAFSGYFGEAKDWEKEGPYDVKKDPYQFFVEKDGKFVERPYPDNFFAKIGYFFKKLWYSNEVKWEKTKIDNNEANIEKVLNEVPAELKEQQTIADVSTGVAVEAEPQPEANRIESKEFTEGLKEAANDETPAPNNNDAAEKTEENVASI